MNTQFKFIKVRIYPNKSQTNYLNNLFGCCRFTFNKCLDLKINSYKEDKTNLGLKELVNYFHQRLRIENIFLQEHNTKILKCSIIHLLDAYKRFYINHTGFPNFKNKHHKQAAQFPFEAISKYPFKNNKLNLTKQLKNLKFNCSDNHFSYLIDHQKDIRSITISKTNTDKYFASILISFESELKPINSNIVGIDLGINSYLTDSNNIKIDNPKWLRKNIDKLKDYQRINSKKTKDSNNYNKYKKKIALTHEKIVNQRTNFLHTLSSKIINENQVIVLENLDVSEMLKNHNLAQSISELSWYTFLEQLKYKSIWYNRDFILVDKYFPSTKLCSCCGNKQDIKLNERIYNCKSCGLQIDRDYNASLNIKKEGLRIFNSKRLGCHDSAQVA